MYKQLLLNFVFYVISIACIEKYRLSFGNLEALLSLVAILFIPKGPMYI